MTQDEYRYDSMKFAIADTQATIRAMDVKLQVLLAFLVMAIIDIRYFFQCFYAGFSLKSSIGHIDLAALKPFTMMISLLFVFLWATSVFLAARGLISINNPAERIQGVEGVGNFYGNNLFTFDAWSVIGSNKALRSDITLNDYIALLPADFDSIIRELTYEYMKLVYIREIKIRRQRWAYISLCIWLPCFFILAIMNGHQL